MPDYSIVFILTSAISLFAQVVLVFSLVKIEEEELKSIFRFFFFALLIFAVGQIALLVSIAQTGFDYALFISVNSFFSFILAIAVLAVLKEAEVFSKKVSTGEINEP
ncbi:MAG: hypothetical protein COV47_05200 [Candidatus Diapherotrites archaeon CG11_big_fil_rev_8_21_14_0_20_37_9]|nr:MAG: hypothetical protein COV47_05200 [Candidatus Diapherotrites archaeon CG11_big_fil_rev_8_21_14_0_20_37_9]